MTRTVDAIFENDNPDNPLELALQVYQGLSEEDIDEIERIALDRRALFATRAERLS